MSHTEPSVLNREESNVGDKQKHQEEKILPFPYEIRNVDPEVNVELKKEFLENGQSHVQIGPEKWFFPNVYAKDAENFYNLKLREDDVFVVSLPRSGTTWTQEMVWLICNDLNYQKAAEISLDVRFPFLEFDCFIRGAQDSVPKFTKMDRSQRRFIKTHIPFSLLPPKLTTSGCKIVYVARNPKDAAVSYYLFTKARGKQVYKYTNFKEFWSCYKQNLVCYTPYWEHIKEGWNRRHEENVLFMFYENMNKNLRSTLEELATFFGKSYTSKELEILENHLKIDNLKRNKAVNNVNGLIREGKTGGWKDYFDEELEKSADQWIQENFKDTDLRFPL